MTIKNSRFACDSTIERDCNECNFVPPGSRITKLKSTSFRYPPLLLSTAIAALICATDGMQSASAQSVTATGDLNYTPPGGTQNWTVGDDLVVGDTAPGTLLIDAGGTVDNNDAYVGNQAGAVGTITVQGSDGSGNASTWTNNGEVMIGVETGSNGTLNILNGGAVHSGQGLIGVASGSDGHVTVSGLGSIWDPFDNIYVGFEGTGELDVLDGATVSTEQTGGGAATIYLGLYNGGQGTVTVSSSTADTSTLSVTDDLRIGVGGSGVMTVEQGGLVRVGDNVHIADTATGSGTLHLNGDATGRGIIETGSVIAGPGTVDLDLNGGILRANRNEANFLNGFAAETIGAEGAWFDTNTHTIGISTAFTGTSSFNKLGAGTLILTGDSSTFTGNTEVQAGTLQIDGTLGGPTDVLAGARLTGIGQVGITTNRGVIAPGHVGSLGTLTIAGNYTPVGGSIEIKTQLGDDTSPTDRLVITGSTSGSTPVTVTNFGGAGAQTTEGIKIIDVAGASTGTFTLQGTTTYEGDPAVVAGAYAYRLYQGGASTPADGDWYLRSALLSTSAPSDTPLYQPGVPSYEAYPQILLGLNGVPTLQQRVGNRFWNDAKTASATDNGNGTTGAFTETNGMWVRVEGGHRRIDPKYSTVDGDYEYDMVKTQVGLDAMLSQNDSGKLVGGLTAHYVHGSAETSWHYGTDNYGSGDISTDGYGFGGTLTWYGNNGFYVDGTAQVTWYSSDLSAHPVGGLENSNDAFGSTLSVESGKRIAMHGDWSLTPQVQLTYSKARFDNFSDVFGASIRPGRDDSLQGRLGISLERQVDRTHLYGIANLYNEFFDGTSVTINDKDFHSRNDRLWAGIGFGGSYNWDNDRYSIYGEGTVNTSLAGNNSYGYGATIGFRAKW